MINKYGFLLFLTILISCNSNRFENISIKERLNNDFSFNEIKSLNELILFFDTIVLNQSGLNSIDSAYHYYMESLRYNDSNEDFFNKLTTDKTEIDFFIKKFKKEEVFNKIWKIYYGMDRLKKDTLWWQLEPNQQGKYFSILNIAIENDTIFNEYKESLIESGTIPPTIIAGFQNIHERLDFDNEVIRLIVAIHYISIKSYTRLNNKKSVQNKDL